MKKDIDILWDVNPYPSFKNARENAIILANRQNQLYFVITRDDKTWTPLTGDALVDPDRITIDYIVFPSTHTVSGGRIKRV